MPKPFKQPGYWTLTQVLTNETEILGLLRQESEHAQAEFREVAAKYVRAQDEAVADIICRQRTIFEEQCRKLFDIIRRRNLLPANMQQAVGDIDVKSSDRHSEVADIDVSRNPCRIDSKNDRAAFSDDLELSDEPCRPQKGNVVQVPQLPPTSKDACTKQAVHGQRITSSQVDALKQHQRSENSMSAILSKAHDMNEMKSSLRGGFDHPASKSIDRLFNYLPEALSELAIAKMEGFLGWWSTVKEPKRSGIAHFITKSKAFGMFIIATIIANGLFIVASTDYSVKNLDTDSVSWIRGLETFFLTIYVIEIVLRLCAHRVYFFINHQWRWNQFDFVVIFLAVLDRIMENAFDDNAGVNITFLRITRIFKLSKVLRLIRAMHFITDLRLMIGAFVGSIHSIVWALCMMVVIILFFSLFFVQLVTTYLKTKYDENTSFGDTEEDMIVRFGSVFRCMVTLFMTTTGGADWGEFYRLLSNTGNLGKFSFLFYVSFMTIAVWNIVTCIFIDKVMRLAKPTADAEIAQRMRDDLAAMTEVRAVCRDLDVDNSGTINKEEFLLLQRNPKFRNVFGRRGIDIKDAELFFTMLATVGETEELSIDDLVQGCLRMKGLASAADLHGVHFETKLLHSIQRNFIDYCHEQFTALFLRLDLMSSNEMALS